MDHKESFFTEKELEFINDSEFLRVKQAITTKIHSLLRKTEASIKYAIQSENLLLPSNLLVKAGKISKGKRYQDLPYQVLDYPRLFNQEDILTFRTMFWWGNLISCTLHIQGASLDQHRERIIRHLEKMEASDTYFCVGNTPWQYHYDPENYQLMGNIPRATLESMVRTRPFVKFSRKLPVAQTHRLPDFAEDTFLQFSEVFRE